MIDTQPGSGSERETHGNYGAWHLPEDVGTVPLHARTHAVQDVTQTMPGVQLRWREADDVQFARFVDAYTPLHLPESTWHADALAALEAIDEEIGEEHFPEINAATKAEAKRIIGALARRPSAPTVYPTQDAEIAIHFKAPDSPNSVVILLNNNGQADCYAYTGGSSRRAHYDICADLPDGFLEEQLRALAPVRVDVSSQAREISSREVMLVADLWRPL